MTTNEIFDLYVLQSKNVRQLKKAQSNLIKDINFHLKKNDIFQVELKTKLLALLYSTLSEAEFIQIVHTPNGFLDSEITKIKTGKHTSLENGWNTIIDLAMNKVGNWSCNKDLKKRRDDLRSIIKEYIIEPSLLRNKIAHGQWEVALNKETTKENQELTNQLKTLNVVEIQKWFNVHQFLAFIIRDLIQSPKKGFHNNYWSNLTKLQEYLKKTKSWTLQTKINQLMRKHSKTKNYI